MHHVLVGAVGGQRDEQRAEQRGPDGELAFQHALDGAPTGAVVFHEFRVRRDIALPFPEFQIVRAGEVAFRALPAAGDVPQQIPDREPERAEEHRDLQHIRPDHRLDSADRRVGRRENGDENQRAAGGPELFPGAERPLRIELVPNHDHQQRRHPQPGAAGQRAGHQENHTRHAAGARAETDFQKLINAHHVVFVKRRDEHRAHHQPRQQIADHQLRIRVIPQPESLARRAEKRPRADLGRENGRQHRPPRDRPAAEREIRDVSAPAAEMPADADDDGEINSNDEQIQPQSRHAPHARGAVRRSKPQVSPSFFGAPAPGDFSLPKPEVMDYPFRPA